MKDISIYPNLIEYEQYISQKDKLKEKAPSGENEVSNDRHYKQQK